MGLSSEVNKHIKEVLKDAPPGTRSNSLEYSEQESKRQKVIITDMMASPNGVFTWFKPNTDPSLDLPMTGLDYWEKFKTFMLTRMAMKPRYLVITVDDRHIVPIEKEPTQANRLKYSKVKEPIRLDEEAESKGLLFYDHGLMYPGGRLSPEPISPSLCRGSSHLRKPLARYLLHKLETWLRENFATCTSFWCTSLIFDYDGSKFLMLEFDKTLGVKVTWHNFVKGFPVYGEADGKVVAWANFFMDQYNIQIETIDSDIMGWKPQLVKVHNEKKYDTCIHWITKGRERGELVFTELRMSTDYLKRSLQFTTNRDLLVWMIVMGTDFWKKNELTNGFGMMDIVKAIRRTECSRSISLITYNSVDIPFGEEREKSQVYINEIRHCKNTLIFLLEGLSYPAMPKKPKKNKDGTTEWVIPPKLKNKPNDSKLEELARRLWWHIGYWEMNWGISLDIIKRCQEKRNNKQTTTTTTKAIIGDDHDHQNQKGPKNLISPLIPVPLEPL